MLFTRIGKLGPVRTIKGNEHARMAILALIVGLTAGFGAVGFRYLIMSVQSIAFGSGGNLLEAVSGIPWYWVILIPAAGGVVVGPLVYFFAREAKGHGVPEVMEAVALRRGVIRKRVVLVKSFASAICIGTGGSVGREGPIVQIGSAIGSTVGQLLRCSDDRMRALVGCGAAAGIAATFNAPISGTMFALEIILGEFGPAIFSPIVISSVTATAISRHYLGDFPAFFVPPYKLVSAWEFPLYFFLGIFCALVGVLFIKTLYASEDLYDKIRFPDYLKALTGGLLIGCMALLFPHILGVGYEAIDLALNEQMGWYLLFLLVIIKIAATSLTIGSGGSGGIFAPSLFMGAMAGGAFGTLVNGIFPAVTAPAAAYCIVGMGAVVSATTHGPLTAMLMLFEMTGDYKIILPMMITCIVSALFARHLLPESIYTLKLIRRGIDIKGGKEVNVLKSMHVGDVMNPDVVTLSEEMSMGALAELISKSKYNSFPMLDKDGFLAGILSYRDYSEALFNDDLKDLVLAKDIATRDVKTVTSENNLFDAFESLSVKDFSIIPVVDPKEPGKLVGVLTRRDIIGAYNKAVIKKDIISRSPNAS